MELTLANERHWDFLVDLEFTAPSHRLSLPCLVVMAVSQSARPQMQGAPRIGWDVTAATNRTDRSTNRTD
jgi:hypothetical protein